MLYGRPCYDVIKIIKMDLTMKYQNEINDDVYGFRHKKESRIGMLPFIRC